MTQSNLFQSAQDAAYLKARAGEYGELYRPNRVLYRQSQIAAISGTVGATSAVVTNRLFTDTTKDFSTTVLVNSLLRIAGVTDDFDNGDYKVVQIVNVTTLKVDSDWPYGGKTGLPYEVIYHDVYGDPASGSVAWTATAAIPFLLIMDPSPVVCTKYGYDRPRNGILVFAAKTLEDNSITPKVGDRFVDDEGREQEITDIRPDDLFTGSGVHVRWLGSSEVTHKRRIST